MKSAITHPSNKTSTRNRTWYLLRYSRKMLVLPFSPNGLKKQARLPPCCAARSQPLFQSPATLFLPWLGGVPSRLRQSTGYSNLFFVKVHTGWRGNSFLVWINKFHLCSALKYNPTCRKAVLPPSSPWTPLAWLSAPRLPFPLVLENQITFTSLPDCSLSHCMPSQSQ